MKKIFVLVLMMALVVTLAACGQETRKTAAKASKKQTVAEETVTDETEATTEAPTEPEATTEAPTEPEATTEAPTEPEDMPEVPAETPAEPEETPTEPEKPAETPTEPEKPVETPVVPDNRPVHTHSYTGKVTKAATCGAAGTKTYTCTCGKSYTESIPATGHSWGAWTTQTPATAIAKGVSQRSCGKCSAVETKDIAMLPNYFKDTNIDGRYTGNEPYYVLAREVYFQDGTLIVHAYVVNQSRMYVSGLDIVKMSVYDTNGKKIAEAFFNDQNFMLDPMSYVNHTFAFGSDLVASYAVDLTEVYVNITYDF